MTNKKVKPLNVFISGAAGTQSRILSILFQGSDKDFHFFIWRTRKGESIKNDCKQPFVNTGLGMPTIPTTRGNYI